MNKALDIRQPGEQIDFIVPAAVSIVAAIQTP